MGVDANSLIWAPHHFMESDDADAQLDGLDGPLQFGQNFAKKVRKHIDQVRRRRPVMEDVAPPGKSGIDRVEQIIRDRVALGGGRPTTFAGEAAEAFGDGNVTYIIRLDGTFWTILSNQ